MCVGFGVFRLLYMNDCRYFGFVAAVMLVCHVSRVSEFWWLVRVRPKVEGWGLRDLVGSASCDL